MLDKRYRRQTKKGIQVRRRFIPYSIALMAALTDFGTSRVNGGEAGNWLVAGMHICRNSVKDKVPQDRFCDDSREVLFISPSGYQWFKHDCPKDGNVPYKISNTYGKFGDESEQVVGEMSCATSGPRVTLKRSFVRKTVMPKIGYVSFVKTNVVINLDVADGRCRILSYNSDTHSVGEQIASDGQRKPHEVYDDQVELSHALACRLFATEEAAKEWEGWMKK